MLSNDYLKDIGLETCLDLEHGTLFEQSPIGIGPEHSLALLEKKSFWISFVIVLLKMCVVKKKAPGCSYLLLFALLSVIALLS